MWAPQLGRPYLDDRGIVWRRGTMAGMPDVQRPNMAGYGVPTDLDGTLPWAWAVERLRTNRNYWVVTVDAEGHPHSTPVWGLWHTDDTFWFSCDHSAYKARNIEQNPHVAVTTDSTIEYVSVEGVAVRLPPPQEVAHAWAVKYADGTDDDGPAELETFFAAHAVFGVRPAKAIGMIERPDEFAQKATRWVW